MKRATVAKLYAQFEGLLRREARSGTEFWLARELQKALGYRRWAELARVIHRAAVACAVNGDEQADHFLPLTKLSTLRSSSKRPVEDYALTRYACYLIARCGDESKDRIAFAQSYFAVPSRQLELIERRLDDAERLAARRQLSKSEKVLSGLIYERVGDVRGCGRVRSKGDQALFAGVTTQQMKQRLGVPTGRALADFLPTATLKAKVLANERTNRSVKRDYLHTEAAIAREHVKNNREVRRLLRRRKIAPEQLRPDVDAKKIERRLAAEEKTLSERSPRLTTPVAADHG